MTSDQERRQSTERFAGWCLHQLVLETDHPVFVNLGCNDGITGDPFFRHVMEAGEKITGLYADPVWEYGEIIGLLKRRCPQLWFYPYAISDRSGEAEFRYIPPSVAYRARLEGWGCGCGSIEPNCHEATEGSYAEHFELTTVQTVAWDEFLVEARVDEITALNMDIEGHESTVIPLIDFESIKWAQIELRHIPKEHQADLFRDLIQGDSHIVLGGVYDAYVIDRELFSRVRDEYRELCAA